MPLLRGAARVIAPSLPGYTYSFRPGDRRYSIVDCADRIHAMLRALGHERYLVAGGGWGARIACPLPPAPPGAGPGRPPYIMPPRPPRTPPGAPRAPRAGG